MALEQARSAEFKGQRPDGRIAALQIPKQAQQQKWKKKENLLKHV